MTLFYNEPSINNQIQIFKNIKYNIIYANMIFKISFDLQNINFAF